METKTFDLEGQIRDFCKAIHPTTIRATLIEDWFHEPGGHIKTVLVNKALGSESIEEFITAVRDNVTFNKFILDQKYQRHNGEAIPWFGLKTGKTFWKRRHFFSAECGANIGFGVGNSTYYFTVRVEELH